jgi:hypothetical protein
MPAEFPQHKGVLLLDPKKPAGMFIVYPNEGQSDAELLKQFRETVAGMFLHDSKTEIVWKSAAIAPHQGITGETGAQDITSADAMEVQLTTYTRTFGETQVVYGYFAMRNQSGKGKDADGRFLDGAGAGSGDFEKFWKSISPSKD